MSFEGLIRKSVISNNLPELAPDSTFKSKHQFYTDKNLTQASLLVSKFRLMTLSEERPTSGSIRPSDMSSSYEVNLIKFESGT